MATHINVDAIKLRASMKTDDLASAYADRDALIVVLNAYGEELDSLLDRELSRLQKIRAEHLRDRDLAKPGITSHDKDGKPL